MEIAAEQLLKNKIVFIIGLHRSGTTLLEDILSKHADVSAFENTGFPMDEGQYLQTVYPIGQFYGGPGKFGFSEAAHLTESSPLCTAANRNKLLSEWGDFWDFSKTYLLEKSPPHIITTRFLHALFPEACFVIITRHPLAVALATQKWSRTSIYNLIRHWLHCHTILVEDLKFVPNHIWMKYEDLTANPEAELNRVADFIGLDRITVEPGLIKDSNGKYFERWKASENNWFKRQYHQLIRNRFEKAANAFDYSLNIP